MAHHSGAYTKIIRLERLEFPYNLFFYGRLGCHGAKGYPLAVTERGGRLGLRIEKLTSLVRFFLAFFLLLIMRPDRWTYEASTPSWKPVQGHP